SCIAPDYLIVERGIEDRLIEQIKKSVQDFYGASVQTSYPYVRIVDKNHFQRLKRVFDNTKVEIVFGGETLEDDLYIASTLILN
ncbi:hypothetical protein BGZ65_011593, partial [Modicella reniformis]